MKSKVPIIWYVFYNFLNPAEVERLYEDLQDLLKLTPPKDVLFIIGDWNAKVGSQEISGVTGRFALECEMKQSEDYSSFSKKMHWS